MASSIAPRQNGSFEDYLKLKIDTKFECEQTSPTHIKNIIQNLNSKSSSGYDNISTILLKKLEPLLSGPLSIIINQSLKSGIFPNKLKTAKIIPIYKKGDKHKIDNCRPISLLPSISKIFEKVAHDQLLSYFVKYNILYNSQYGFRKLHSTQHAILELTDRILLDLDVGNTPLGIFLDLSKAFDTLNHPILISKLKYYGLQGNTLKWFRNYLQDRRQYVEINDKKSNIISTNIGVPQGSILGPLLFNIYIYINDIQCATDFFHLISYADDTTLYRSLSRCHDPNISHYINTELEKVYTWLCYNRLSLNINKTKYMIFHTRGKNISLDHFNLKVDKSFIEYVHNFNFLGVTFNHNMDWNSHIDTVSTKISRSVGILSKLKHYLPLEILKTLYNSLIVPHFTYGILAWGSNTSRMFQMQKKCVRLITNSKYNAHTNPLFLSLNLLKLEDIYKINILKFHFQYCHNLLPFYLQNLNFRQQSDVHQHNTRNKNFLYVEKTLLKLSDKSLRHNTVKLINTTPNCMLDKIHSHSLQGLTNYCKLYYISSYNPTCNVDNCYVCNAN